MVIEHIFDTINLILNKNRRGFVRKSVKVTAVKAAMFDFFRSEVDVYRMSGVIPTSVKKFVKTAELTLSNGISILPTDFSQEVAFETDAGSEGVFLSPEVYQDRMHSSILDPDQENPIAKIENNRIFIQPDEFLTTEFTYFRIPNDFVYDTTLAGDSRSEEFNEAGSTDIEFGIEYSSEITRRALAYLGVAYQNNEALAIAINDNKE